MIGHKVGPDVGRLHWEGTLGRSHDKPLVRHEVDHFVCVGEGSSQKTSHKGKAGSGRQWHLGLPGNTLDIGVPVWSVVRISDISGHHLTWSGDVDQRRDVDGLHDTAKRTQYRPSTRQ